MDTWHDLICHRHRAQRIALIVSNEPENNLLRVSVEGGGCSGFEYHCDLVSNAEPEDILIERAGAKVLVDAPGESKHFARRWAFS